MKIVNLIAASALLCAGCRIPPPISPSATPATAQQPDPVDLLRNDVETLQKMVETLQQSNDELYIKIEQNRQNTLQADERLQNELNEIKTTQASQPGREEKLKSDIAEIVSQKLAQTAARPTPAASPATTPYKPSSNLANVKEAQEHVVQPGESLSTIASAYKVKVGDIMQLNGIKNANLIRPGQKLLIPVME